MLLRRAQLDGIRAGDISLAFRRWKRPTVKAGGRLKTAVGELAIEAVEPVTLQSITAKESRAAGFESLADLLQELRQREGRVYRIRLHYAGVDPRIALRAQDDLSESELEALAARLRRSDAQSRGGAWTTATLRLIANRPAIRAADLADELGLATQPFKQRVRRLKGLGLTESLEVGYRLSPRGKALLGGWKRGS